MESSEDWVSLREFARRVGVNVAAVQQAISNGRIQRRGDDKKLHWVSQSRAWDEFRDPSKVRDDEDEDESPEGGQSGFQEAKTRKEVAVAGLKELELQVALGEVVKSAHVKNAMAQFAIDVRESIMTIPDRVAAELAAEVAKQGSAFDLETAREIVHRLWRRESRVALERIARAGGER